MMPTDPTVSANDRLYADDSSSGADELTGAIRKADCVCECFFLSLSTGGDIGSRWRRCGRDRL